MLIILLCIFFSLSVSISVPSLPLVHRVLCFSGHSHISQRFTALEGSQIQPLPRWYLLLLGSTLYILQVSIFFSLPLCDFCITSLLQISSSFNIFSFSFVGEHQALIEPFNHIGILKHILFPKYAFSSHLIILSLQHCQNTNIFCCSSFSSRPVVISIQLAVSTVFPDSSSGG